MQKPNRTVLTSTTRIEDFKEGGKKACLKHYLLKAQSSPFDEDCIINFDERPYDVPKTRIEKNSSIQIKGVLDENTLRIIYNGIRTSRFFSKRVLMDIHESLNRIGITKLKKPK